MSRRTGLHFPRSARVLLSLVFLTSLTTGLWWYYLHRWGQVESEWGDLMPHPWQKTLLRVHGASAFCAMMSFGFLLARHLPPAWRTRRHRLSGLPLTMLVVTMIVSGYALYYAGEELRPLAADVHLYSGLALPVVLLAHIVQRVTAKRNPAHGYP